MTRHVGAVYCDDCRRSTGGFCSVHTSGTFTTSRTVREPLWTWMEGRTIQGLHGGYIARIWREGGRWWDMPSVARYHGGRHEGIWEIEGYGDTPEAAIAGLRSKFHGAIAEPES